MANNSEKGFLWGRWMDVAIGNQTRKANLKGGDLMQGMWGIILKQESMPLFTCSNWGSTEYVWSWNIPSIELKGTALACCPATKFQLQVLKINSYYCNHLTTKENGNQTCFHQEALLLPPPPLLSQNTSERGHLWLIWDRDGLCFGSTDRSLQ
jgi:hypothetical protein